MFGHELIVKEQSLRHMVGREGRPSQALVWNTNCYRQ